MKWMRVVLNVAIVAAIFALAAAGFAFLVKNKPEPPRRDFVRKGVTVEVRRVEPETVIMNVTGFGTVRPKVDLLLVAQVSGRVDRLSPRLRVGATIRKDELLLRIDPRSYRLAIDSARALADRGRAQLESLDQEKKNLEADRALAKKELEPAKRELDRAESLLKSQTGSEKARDVAETTWLSMQSKIQSIENQLALWPQRRAVAEANLKQSEAQLNEAKLNLEYTEIHAPFDGRVSERLVEAGQFVAPGTALARIYDSSLMEISIRVPLEDFNWVDTACFFQSHDKPVPPDSRPAAMVRLKVGDHTCVWQGVVSRVDGQIDRATRTAGLIVEARPSKLLCDKISYPANPTGAGSGNRGHNPTSNPGDDREVYHAPLIPGLFVEVEIEGRPADNVFTLPRGAIDRDNRVYLAVDGKLESRPVRLLRADDGRAFVTGGIRSGDRVIVSPLSTPVEGMTVRIAGEEEKKRENR